MAQPSIKQLEAFWWAATCSSFVTAAERLNLSVSSLSKRISELESVLRQPLFDRSGHKAVLTQAGERLLPAALQVLNAMAALGQTLDNSSELTGHCRIGVGDLSAQTWLPSLIAAMRRQHPGLMLEAYVDVGGVLEQRLSDGELDFAVLAGRSSRSNLLSQPTAAAHFAWAMHPALASPANQSLGALLQQHALVTLPADAGTTRLLDDWLLAHHISVGERIVCNNWAAVAGILCEGVGIGFLPAGWLAPLQLQALAPEMPLAPLQYSLQWRRGDSRLLVTALQQLASQHVNFALPPALAYRQG